MLHRTLNARMHQFVSIGIKMNAHRFIARKCFSLYARLRIESSFQNEPFQSIELLNIVAKQNIIIVIVLSSWSPDRARIFRLSFLK